GPPDGTGGRGRRCSGTGRTLRNSYAPYADGIRLYETFRRQTVSRWFRLASAVVAMIMIGNLQYSWTLFVKPLIAAHHWRLSDVQWAFTFFIACQTWFMPIAGWLIDRLGPRKFMTVAGLLCGVGWAAMGTATSLTALYTLYAAAGVGASLVYCGSMGVALKWFPDKR